MRAASRIVSTAALSLVLAGAALAQSQLDLDMQAGRDFKAADRALNVAYQKLLSKSAPKGRERLRAAQRAWVLFRDADCEARTPRGGSVYPMTYAMCLTDLTKARTKVLNGEMHCEEGDLSCGGELNDE